MCGSPPLMLKRSEPHAKVKPTSTHRDVPFQCFSDTSLRHMLYSASHTWFWRFVTDRAPRIFVSTRGATLHQCRKLPPAEVREVFIVLKERRQRKRPSRARFVKRCRMHNLSPSVFLRYNKRFDNSPPEHASPLKIFNYSLVSEIC